MIKKIFSIVLCICMFFSVSATVFAGKSYTVEKEDNRYSVLTGEVTKVSPGQLQLSKTSNDLWSKNVGAIQEDAEYIILDTTDFEDKEFCDGEVIRAYFQPYHIDDRPLKDDYVFELLYYERNDEQISVDKAEDFLEKIGVLNGYEDGKPHLERNITRAEFTMLMVKIYHDYDLTFMSGNTIEGKIT